ncbi:hypothetical protein KEJ47_00705 [Candidatus Bathyarchaeota archaeon]|nr:hypothetical protein [Candidatus Bathyarchaeota archaeon]
MGYEDKVDVIDLIINVLREHEKNLDDLVARLENVVTKTESTRPSPAKTEIPAARIEAPKLMISAVIKNWGEFREKSLGASLVAFDVDEKKFNVSVLKDGVLYSYNEDIPELELRFKEKDQRIALEELNIGRAETVPTILRGRLKCGLEVSLKGLEVKLPEGSSVYKVSYDIDDDESRSWLSFQLKTDKKNIIRGMIKV